MKSRSAPDEGKLARTSNQISRLYDRLVYWLYERQDASRARSLASQMKNLLAKNPKLESIFNCECSSLVHEASGDLDSAIKDRKKEIRLIRRLHQRAQNKPGASFVFGQYDYADLRDRLDLLAMLYHDRGDLDKGIRTL